MKRTLDEIGMYAMAAKPHMQLLGTTKKNQALEAVANALNEKADYLIAENEKDMQAGKEAGMHQGLLDRLLLTKDRIAQMAEGLIQITGLEDPIGEVLSMKKRPNGLLIGQKRVPLGVVGIIYESRPNVTADAFGLCFKTGNVVVLKGGSDAMHSNIAIVKVIREALRACKVDEDAIQLIEDTDRAVTTALMKRKDFLDVLIPRGGAGLIRAVVENSTVPVIETGTGNCHIYVDESADLDMAVNIIFNAKTQRIGVCNACESLVVHEKVEKALMPLLKAKLDEKSVEIRGDEQVQESAFRHRFRLWRVTGEKNISIISSPLRPFLPSTKQSHISTAITPDIPRRSSQEIMQMLRNFLKKWMQQLSMSMPRTRFTDGFEFGFGAEIGISTQKLHARGPMGLTALTTTKYIIYGNGQVR